MTTQSEIFSADLAGVIVGETAISDVRGEAGILSYRGITITELVDKPFQEVAWLVVFGEWPIEAIRACDQLNYFIRFNSCSIIPWGVYNSVVKLSKLKVLLLKI